MRTEKKRLERAEKEHAAWCRKLKKEQGPDRRPTPAQCKTRAKRLANAHKPPAGPWSGAATALWRVDASDYNEPVAHKIYPDTVPPATLYRGGDQEAIFRFFALPRARMAVLLIGDRYAPSHQAPRIHRELLAFFRRVSRCEA